MQVSGIKGKVLDDGIVHECGRRLSDREIGHLQYLLKPIYDSALSYDIMDMATQKIAEIHLKEEVHFEDVLKIFENANPDEKTYSLIKEVYRSPIPEKDIYPLHEILTNHCDVSLDIQTAKKIEYEIYSTIKKNPFEGMIVIDVGSDIEFINNHLMKRVIYRQVNEKNGVDYSKEKTVIGACIKELTVYNNPLNEDPREFKVTFNLEEDNKPLTIGPCLIEDVTNFLTAEGHVINHRLVKDALPSLFKAFMKWESYN